MSPACKVYMQARFALNVHMLTPNAEVHWGISRDCRENVGLYREHRVRKCQIFNGNNKVDRLPINDVGSDGQDYTSIAVHGRQVTLSTTRTPVLVMTAPVNHTTSWRTLANDDCVRQCNLRSDNFRWHATVTSDLEPGEISWWTIIRNWVRCNQRASLQRNVLFLYGKKPRHANGFFLRSAGSGI